MAKLKYKEMNRSSVSSTNIVSGQIIHCLDTGEVFYDNGNTVRLNVTTIIPVGSINSVVEPIQYRLYIDRQMQVVGENTVYASPDDVIMYIYNSSGNFQQVTETSEVNGFLSPHMEIEPSIIEESGRARAPITLARCVYMEDGSTLQDIAKDIKRLKVSTQSLTASGTTLTITPPYTGYFDNPDNHILVFLNGNILASNKYSVANNKITFTSSTSGTISIVYIYQVDSLNSDVNTIRYIDGAYILDNSITTNKLNNVTSSYTSDDETALVNAKALHDLHANLSSTISNIDSTAIVYATDSSTSGSKLIMSISGYTLNDCNIITVRTKYDLAASCKVKINSLSEVPIYTDTNTVLAANIVKANSVITLRYNKTDNRFYLINPDLYKVVKDRVKYTVTGANVTTIPITLDSYNSITDCVDVYYQNIRLFDPDNYSLSGNNIVLNGFSATSGDVFIFERSRVKTVNL